MTTENSSNISEENLVQMAPPLAFTPEGKGETSAVGESGAVDDGEDPDGDKNRENATKKKKARDKEKDKEVEMVDASPSGRFLKFNAEIGRGSFKTVYRGLDTQEGVAVAWCELQDHKLNKCERNRFREEAELLKKLNHQNIVRFFDYWEVSQNKKKCTVLVTELMVSGTLKGYLSRFKRVNLSVLKNWGRQILNGLHFLHTRTPPIIHRDLKCDNIFITGPTGSVKIGDLGLATIKHRSYAKSVIGTPEFMAPEMYDEHYDEKVDVYAFGMCMMEMVTSEYPYAECKGPAQIYKKVTHGVKPTVYRKIENEEILDVIDLCIAAKKEDRPSAKEILDHEFFNEDIGFELECVNFEEALLSGSMELLFRLHVTNPKKFTPKYESGNKAIEFSFQLDTDTCGHVCHEMVSSGHIYEADERRIIQMLQSRVNRFMKEKKRFQLQQGLNIVNNQSGNMGVFPTGEHDSSFSAEIDGGSHPPQTVICKEEASKRLEVIKEVAGESAGQPEMILKREGELKSSITSCDTHAELEKIANPAEGCVISIPVGDHAKDHASSWGEGCGTEMQQGEKNEQTVNMERPAIEYSGSTHPINMTNRRYPATISHTGSVEAAFEELHHSLHPNDEKVSHVHFYTANDAHCPGNFNVSEQCGVPEKDPLAQHHFQHQQSDIYSQQQAQMTCCTHNNPMENSGQHTRQQLTENYPSHIHSSYTNQPHENEDYNYAYRGREECVRSAHPMQDHTHQQQSMVNYSYQRGQNENFTPYEHQVDSLHIGNVHYSPHHSNRISLPAPPMQLQCLQCSKHLKTDHPRKFSQNYAGGREPVLSLLQNRGERCSDDSILGKHSVGYAGTSHFANDMRDSRHLGMFCLHGDDDEGIPDDSYFPSGEPNEHPYRSSGQTVVGRVCQCQGPNSSHWLPVDKGPRDLYLMSPANANTDWINSGSYNGQDHYTPGANPNRRFSTPFRPKNCDCDRKSSAPDPCYSYGTCHTCGQGARQLKNTHPQIGPVQSNVPSSPLHPMPMPTNDGRQRKISTVVNVYGGMNSQSAQVRPCYSNSNMQTIPQNNFVSQHQIQRNHGYMDGGFGQAGIKPLGQNAGEMHMRKMSAPVSSMFMQQQPSNMHFTTKSMPSQVAKIVSTPTQQQQHQQHQIYLEIAQNNFRKQSSPVPFQNFVPPVLHSPTLVPTSAQNFQFPAQNTVHMIHSTLPVRYFDDPVANSTQQTHIERAPTTHNDVVVARYPAVPTQLSLAPDQNATAIIHSNAPVQYFDDPVDNSTQQTRIERAPTARTDVQSVVAPACPVVPTQHSPEPAQNAVEIIHSMAPQSVNPPSAVGNAPNFARPIHPQDLVQYSEGAIQNSAIRKMSVPPNHQNDGGFLCPYHSLAQNENAPKQEGVLHSPVERKSKSVSMAISPLVSQVVLIDLSATEEPAKPHPVNPPLVGNAPKNVANPVCGHMIRNVESAANARHGTYIETKFANDPTNAALSAFLKLKLPANSDEWIFTNEVNDVHFKIDENAISPEEVAVKLIATGELNPNFSHVFTNMMKNILDRKAAEMAEREAAGVGPIPVAAESLKSGASGIQFECKPEAETVGGTLISDRKISDSVLPRNSGVPEPLPEVKARAATIAVPELEQEPGDNAMDGEVSENKPSNAENVKLTPSISNISSTVQVETDRADNADACGDLNAQGGAASLDIVAQKLERVCQSGIRTLPHHLENPSGAFAGGTSRVSAVENSNRTSPDGNAEGKERYFRNKAAFDTSSLPIERGFNTQHSAPETTFHSPEGSEEVKRGRFSVTTHPPTHMLEIPEKEMNVFMEKQKADAPKGLTAEEIEILLQRQKTELSELHRKHQEEIDALRVHVGKPSSLPSSSTNIMASLREGNTSDVTKSENAPERKEQPESD